MLDYDIFGSEHAPAQRAQTGQRPIWQLAAINNAKPVIVTERVNGRKVKTVEGYRK